MEQREKLIELLSQFRECLFDEEIDCNDCDYKDVGECVNTRLADYLLANGVVLPCRCEDCECGYNWMNDGTRKIGKCAFLIGDNQYVSADGFCNFGVRKGGEE